MAKLFKIIFLQVFWYIAVIYGREYNLAVFLSSLLIVLFNFVLYKPDISKLHYIIATIFFSLYGLVQDSLFLYFDFVTYNQDSFPLWLNSLYVVFICYYGDIFNYLRDKSIWILAAMGAFGGAFAFWGGVKLSSIEAITPMYFLAIFLSWAIFFPFTFKVFYFKNRTF